LKLIDNGQWQLDEPLYHYWTDPDVENDPRNKKITTRLVLCHKTGLPNWRGHEPGGKLNFAFEPGTDWKYSGEGYEYLRQALEHKFHLPMEKLVDSLVLKPLEMNDTRYYWNETMDTSLYADRYHEDGSAFEMEKWYEANASNLVLTTVTDYGKFGAAVIKGMGISKQLKDEMISAQAVLKNGKEFGLAGFF
jgi:CubicO group peptidase (beta-lactamase class C family)